MLKVDYQDNIAIVRLKTEDKINFTIAENIKKDFFQLINNEIKKIIFNLKGVRYIDSTGFSVIVSVYKFAKEMHCSFKICNISSEVMELFEITKLNTVLEINNTLEECIASFK
ncbi:MAG: STAS domain-containing protein [Chlorobi bacterium]|nr:STAS domain-containing protein [Chlorobiota bacterium]